MVGDHRVIIDTLFQGDFKSFFLHFKNREVVLSHQGDEFFDFF